MERTEIEKFYRENYDDFVKHASYRLSGKPELAEEAVQDAFVRVLLYGDSFNNNKRIKPWFYTILNNCINIKRTEENNRGVSIDNFGQNPCQELVVMPTTISDHLNLVEIVINDMKDGTVTKKVCELYYLKNMDREEISKMEQISRDNVKQCLHRFRIEYKYYAEKLSL